MTQNLETLNSNVPIIIVKKSVKSCTQDSFVSRNGRMYKTECNFEAGNSKT